MRIYEPSTTLTDLLLGAFALILAFRLLKQNERRSRRDWGLAFVASGVAALLGAASHGFGPQVSLLAQQVMWKCTTITVGLASCFMLAGALRAMVADSRVRSLSLTATYLKFATYATWMLGHDEFIFVIIDYAVAMLIIASITSFDWRREPRRARFILAGIAIAFVGAGVQAAGLGLHEHLNHNDIYHLIQMVALYSLYLGGLLLRDVTSG